MIVTGQATWKRRVKGMILPTWGKHVADSLVLLSDACGSDEAVPTATLRLRDKGVPSGGWGTFKKPAEYATSNANGYELAQLRWPVGLQFAAWLSSRKPFRWAMILDDDAYLATAALRSYVATLDADARRNAARNGGSERVNLSAANLVRAPATGGTVTCDRADRRRIDFAPRCVLPSLHLAVFCLRFENLRQH